MFETKLCLGFLLVLSLSYTIESKCSRGCSLSLGSYYVWRDSNLTLIAKVTNNEIPNIMSYNPQIPNQNSVQQDTRLNIPFTCKCINGDFLGHVFDYTVSLEDTYERIAKVYYSNLTTADWVERFNKYGPNRIPDANAHLNVTVNCSCGDKSVSKDYGLFITYPLRSNESLKSVAVEKNLSLDLLQKYNPDTNVSAGDTIVYIPGKDKNGNYPRLKSRSGSSAGLIVGASIAGLVVILLFMVCIYISFFMSRKMTPDELRERADQASQDLVTGSASEKATESTGVHPANPRLAGVTVDKSVEFSFEELAMATDDFSLANKIGQGGFGAVYYAELRGEKAAIKKMDMQASREFLAELKVLTHVHHLNLVRLIGYCVEGSLFLVYEFIENGNLSEHLRKSDWDPLSWTSRVQIALDSARGLEYIHEHTVPVYIHRDIKSANILIDKNYHAKVADFGLTKLTEVGGTSLQTRLVGTFGYMPPEYAQYGDVSPKVDVYAFGVVMYELISAKEAIVKPTDTMTESRGLVGLFDEVLRQPEPKDDLRQLIDPRLGDTYPLDAVHKLICLEAAIKQGPTKTKNHIAKLMAMLAKACTQENPQLRPSMRSIVVALMTLVSTTEDWDVDSFYKNQALVNLMSGR